jgi:hypothetical protein
MYFVSICEYIKMKPVEIFPRKGGWRKGEKNEGDKSN